MRLQQTIRLENAMAETVLNHSPLAPAITPSPRMIADAREPPGSTLGGSHLQPAMWHRGRGRVRCSSASRSSSKGVVRSVPIRPGSMRHWRRPARCYQHFHFTGDSTDLVPQMRPKHNGDRDEYAPVSMPGDQP